MKKLEIKEFIRLIQLESGQNGNGKAVYLRHWDYGPFASGGLTEIPFKLSQVKRIHNWLGKWIEKEEKK